jgi:D-proline reductase (dithiol) PrdB
MCHQSVGLIASVIEKAGIPTVGLSLLREVTEKVRPPRTLFVPFPFGYPLGGPKQPDLQHKVIAASMRLLTARDPLPILADF